MKDKGEQREENSPGCPNLPGARRPVVWWGEEFHPDRNGSLQEDGCEEVLQRKTTESQDLVQQFWDKGSQTGFSTVKECCKGFLMYCGPCGSCEERRGKHPYNGLFNRRVSWAGSHEKTVVTTVGPTGGWCDWGSKEGEDLLTSSPGWKDHNWLFCSDCNIQDKQQNSQNNWWLYFKMDSFPSLFACII